MENTVYVNDEPADLLIECGECGNPSLREIGASKSDIDDAQQRFTDWIDRAKATEGLAALMTVALKPVFVASEVTDERRSFVRGLSDVLYALAAINKPAYVQDPPHAISGWLGAAERDLSGLKYKGVADEDARICEINDAAGQHAWEVAAEYRFRPLGGRRS